MSDQLLPNIQVFPIFRIDIKNKDIFIEVHDTMKEAMEAVAEIEEWFDGHKMRIGRDYIDGQETVAKRNANERL